MDGVSQAGQKGDHAAGCDRGGGIPGWIGGTKRRETKKANDRKRKEEEEGKERGKKGVEAAMCAGGKVAHHVCRSFGVKCCISALLKKKHHKQYL